jgi:hypothetical protein
MLRPISRPVLVVGGTQVPRVESLCCKVRCDDDLKAARLNRAVSRLLSGPTAHACCELVRLHGMRNRCPTHRSGRVHVLGRTTWYDLHPGRGEECSCERATCRVRQILVVQCRDLSCEAETGRRGSSSRELVGEAPN